jgi:ribosomal protein L24
VFSANISTDAFRKIGILDAFALKYLPGRVYIAASTLDCVQKVLKGTSASGLHHVPQEDLDDLLSFREPMRISARSWVRLRSSKHRNDLAYVISTVPESDEVRIAIVPRISPVKKRNRGRVAPALFDPTAIETAYGKGSVIAVDNGHIFRGQTYRKGLWIVKMFSMHCLEKESRPSLDELLLFKRAGFETMARAIESAIEFECAATLWRHGDRLEVINGPFRGMFGKVGSVDGYNGTVQVQFDVIGRQHVTRDNSEIQFKDVKRYLNRGDNIKAVAGNHKGQGGIVLRVEAGVITFVEDKTLEEVSRLHGKLYFIYDCPDINTVVRSADIRARHCPGSPVVNSAILYKLYARKPKPSDRTGSLHHTQRHERLVCIHEGRTWGFGCGYSNQSRVSL